MEPRSVGPKANRSAGERAQTVEPRWSRAAHAHHGGSSAPLLLPCLRVEAPDGTSKRPRCQSGAALLLPLLQGVHARAHLVREG